MMTHESFTEEGHCSGFQPTWKICSSQIGSFPQFSRWTLYIYSWVYYFTGKLKHLINSWFKWIIANLWMGHGCFVKHPFQSSCLEFQECNHVYGLPIQTKHLLLIMARNPSSFLTLIFKRNLQINILSVDLSRRISDSHQRFMKGTWLKITVTTWQHHTFLFTIPWPKKTVHHRNLTYKDQK